MHINIYGRQSCPYCVKAKRLAEQVQNGVVETVEVEYHDIEAEHLTRVELSEMAGKEVSTVPQIWIDQVHIGGFTEMDDFIKRALAKGTLNFKIG